MHSKQEKNKLRFSNSQMFGNFNPTGKWKKLLIWRPHLAWNFERMVPQRTKVKGGGDISKWRTKKLLRLGEHVSRMQFLISCRKQQRGGRV